MAISDPDYRAFTGTLPDPRVSSIAERAESLFAVVSAEAPVLATRVYRVVVRASGGKQVTARVRVLLQEALDELAATGRVVLGTSDDEESLVCLPGGPEVHRRKRGPRELDEVPLEEVASVVADTWTRAPRMQGEVLKRTILDRLDLVRLTPAVSARLDRAIVAARAGQ